MLLFNSRCAQKIVGDLEGKLPFADASFDSVTAVFVLNYVKNYRLLLPELRRVLCVNGCFVMVLYGKMLNEWQRRQEINHFSANEWKKSLVESGFRVDFYETENILFFKCIKVL